MNRVWIVCTSLLLSIMLAGCPRPNGNGDPMVNDGPFELSLTLESDVIGSKNMNVWIFVSNEAYTRETAPYQDAQLLALRFSASQEVDTTSFMVEKGKFVTLVAFDGDRSDFGAGNVVVDDENANEFLNWEGDVTAGEESEFGVASFAMDRDRAITALYQRMPLLVISQETMNAGGISPGCLALSVSVPLWLSFPGDEVIYQDNTVCGLGAPGVILRGQMRSGSSVTMTAVPLEPQPPNLIFSQWSGGDNCGGDPTCTITVGDAESATITWRPIGS